MKALIQLIAIQGAIRSVFGHGYMKTPRSRNFVAYADGVWWGGDDSIPKKEK